MLYPRWLRRTACARVRAREDGSFFRMPFSFSVSAFVSGETYLIVYPYYIYTWQVSRHIRNNSMHSRPDCQVQCEKNTEKLLARYLQDMGKISLLGMEDCAAGQLHGFCIAAFLLIQLPQISAGV